MMLIGTLWRGGKTCVSSENTTARKGSAIFLISLEISLKWFGCRNAINKPSQTRYAFCCHRHSFPNQAVVLAKYSRQVIN